MSDPAEIKVLNDTTYWEAVNYLAKRETRFGEILKKYGPPPLWAREPGFATLVQIILEQQVSLSSAKAAFEKLRERLGEVTPEGLLTLSDGEMKTVGFSRQKTRYARELARAIIGGTLNLKRLPLLPDEEIRRSLQKIPGIGPWTAEIYLLMALRRQDVWPTHDLALATAARDLFQLASRPTTDELLALAETWRPYRAVAARFLWHFYLSR
ncbi:MAG: DNA-3-methyladenine glycosylase [Calditrichia bacterium]